MDSIGLYLHIPFCKVKCVYCDFYSIPKREADLPIFLDALCSEIKDSGETTGTMGRSVHSIFLGGGTPSLLKAGELEHVLQTIHAQFSLTADCEITLEANPGEVQLDQLRAFRGLGVNRLSLGIQSLRSHHLRFMSRIHTPAQALQALEWAREAGFEDFNADLIFAIPHQTPAEWEEDLKHVIEMGPTHVSTYSLTVEEGTALSRWVKAGHVQVMDEIEDLHMYERGLIILEGAGYGTYEISNHALPGRECRHNLGYWQGQPYLGFGPSAHSYLEGKRWWNLRSLDGYLAARSRGESPIAGRESIDAATSRREYLMTRLRLTAGFRLEEYRRRFGDDFEEEFAAGLQRWGLEYLEVGGGRVRLTRAGMAVANEILTDLM